MEIAHHVDSVLYFLPNVLSVVIIEYAITVYDIKHAYTKYTIVDNFTACTIKNGTIWSYHYGHQRLFHHNLINPVNVFNSCKCITVSEQKNIFLLYNNLYHETTVQIYDEQCIEKRQIIIPIAERVRYTGIAAEKNYICIYRDEYANCAIYNMDNLSEMQYILTKCPVRRIVMESDGIYILTYNNHISYYTRNGQLLRVFDNCKSNILDFCLINNYFYIVCKNSICIYDIDGIYIQNILCTNASRIYPDINTIYVYGDTPLGGTITKYNIKKWNIAQLLKS